MVIFVVSDSSAVMTDSASDAGSKTISERVAVLVELSLRIAVLVDLSEMIIVSGG